jgi:hypothetical protein
MGKVWLQAGKEITPERRCAESQPQELHFGKPIPIWKILLLRLVFATAALLGSCDRFLAAELDVRRAEI